MGLKKQFNVFISSTSKDLNDYRATARLVTLDVGWVPRMMEHMGARPDSTVAACQQILSECDLMVLLVAFRQGWVPTSEEGGNGVDSITAFEFAFAKERNIPVIALLANETWPGNLWEDDDNARKWIKDFRKNLNLPAEFFDYEDTSREESKRLPSFRAKLKTALINFKERQAMQVAPETQLFEAAEAGLLEETSIPFLGPALFGSGLLGATTIACALGKNIPEDTACLATVAEYCEKSQGSRELFLKKLRKEIEAQMLHAEAPKVYDLILAVKPPPLIVSTTYDLVLENKLRTANKLAVVCHVVRSSDAKHDGKILVLRSDEQPQICLADKLDVSGVDHIIYKPLGSPLINDQLGQTLENDEIDTVVITESDHLVFLARLENQHTQVPEKFSRIFQLRSLLFLGYTLDVWQYRLVMQVFHSVGMKQAKATSFAVRKPGSSMEELAWRRLGIDVIQMEPNDFAENVIANRLRQKGENDT